MAQTFSFPLSPNCAFLVAFIAGSSLEEPVNELIGHHEYQVSVISSYQHSTGEKRRLRTNKLLTDPRTVQTTSQDVTPPSPSL